MFSSWLAAFLCVSFGPRVAGSSRSPARVFSARMVDHTVSQAKAAPCAPCVVVVDFVVVVVVVVVVVNLRLPRLRAVSHGRHLARPGCSLPKLPAAAKALYGRLSFSRSSDAACGRAQFNAGTTACSDPRVRRRLGSICNGCA